MSTTHNKASDRVKHGEDDPRSGAYETKPAYTLTIFFDRLLECFLKSNELLVIVPELGSSVDRKWSSLLTYTRAGAPAVDPVAEMRVHDAWGSEVSSWRGQGLLTGRKTVEQSHLVLLKKWSGCCVTQRETEGRNHG